MNLSEIERQQRRLMVLRVVIVTTLLVSAFGVDLLLRPGETLRPLFFLTAAAYGTVLLWAVLDRWLSASVLFLHAQLVGDAFLVTAFVGITGGLGSPMSFLYLLPICVASLLLYRRGGLVTAGICWCLYASLVLAGGQVWSAPWVLSEWLVPADPVRAGTFLLGHLVAFVASALLFSYFSERLRVQGDELTERRGTVARLQALNENIIESINSGLITTDSKGRIQFMNRGGADITGHAQNDVTGRFIDDLFGLEPGFVTETRNILLAKRRFRFERDYRTPDGRDIFLGIAVSNLHDRHAQPLGYIFIFQDLTEIRDMERELRLKDRMAALGEMAAGMAHELRNPLASMSGAVQYLKGSMKPAGETLELMDIILRESQRLEQAIRDFLTFARPSRFSPEPCDLVRLLDESAKLLEKSLEFGRNHKVTTRFSAGEVWSEVDPNRMKQVFWNLATNALKAMPDGGTLTLEVRGGNSKEAEVTFADEGIGMDERDVAGYFQPFRSSFREGTGLGAAIVYRIVEEHGGRIHLDSAPGRGTRVTIHLPRRVANQPAPAGLMRTAAGGGAWS